MIDFLGAAVLAHVIGVVNVDGSDQLLTSLSATGRLNSEIDIDLPVFCRAVGLPGVDHDVAGLV